MRATRLKKYRKLMRNYEMTFPGLREPYQVLLDETMLVDLHHCKMPLSIFSTTLQGKIKPMITACSIRHLFALPTTSGTNPPSASSTSNSPLTQAEKNELIKLSQTWCELRKCSHHKLAEPLSTLECHQSVIDPKSSGTNKHHLVLAVQDERVRAWARTVKGVPILYLKRSVLVMEPMSDVSIQAKESMERVKLRGGIKEKKRKREDGAKEEEEGEVQASVLKKSKKGYGAKGPNPLSVKKKKVVEKDQAPASSGTSVKTVEATKTIVGGGRDADRDTEVGRRKRRRKHKGAGGVPKLEVVQDGKGPVADGA